MTAQCFLLIAITGTTNLHPTATRESIRYDGLGHRTYHWSGTDMSNCTLARTTNTPDHAHHAH